MPNSNQSDGRTQRQEGIRTERLIDRWTDRYTNRQTDTQTDRQIDRQTDRQTQRQMAGLIIFIYLLLSSVGVGCWQGNLKNKMKRLDHYIFEKLK